MSAEHLALDGELSPPMVNGEVVFESPWQSRAFGMARALCERGLYTWDEFRERLIEEIAAADAKPSGDEYLYYDHFLAALLRLLEEKDICLQQDVMMTARDYAARPHGHDHSHHHDHQP